MRQAPNQLNESELRVSLASLERELLRVEAELVNFQTLMERRNNLRQVIGAIKQLIGENPNAPPPPPEDVPFWKRAEQILSQAKRPMTAKEIADALVVLGAKIDGKTPAESIRTTLIRKPDVFRRLPDGKFVVTGQKVSLGDLLKPPGQE